MSCEPGCLVCARLRRAALQLVGNGGIEGISLDTLAERAGWSLEEVRDHYATAGDCLWATYDEASFGLFLTLAGAFVQSGSWEAAVSLALRRLVAWLDGCPAEARLCFVEALRGDRWLRDRWAERRQWVIELFTAEHRRRRRHGESELQIELLVGAAVQLIDRALSQGGSWRLRALEPKLLDLMEVFTPAAV